MEELTLFELGSLECQILKLDTEIGLSKSTLMDFDNAINKRRKEIYNKKTNEKTKQ